MGSISVKVVSASDNTSASYDDDLGNAIVENPLVDAVNGQEAHAGFDHISVSVLKNREKTSSYNIHRQYPEDVDGAPLEPSVHHQKYPSRYHVFPFAPFWGSCMCSITQFSQFGFNMVSIYFILFDSLVFGLYRRVVLGGFFNWLLV